MAYSHAARPAETAAHRTKWTLPWPLGAALAVYALLLANGSRLLNDADTYWHIALGRWIIANHAVPHVDTFSATMAGKPWISSEWLSQVLYAEAQAVFGWNGVVILAALAIATAFGLACRFLAARLTLVPAVALAAAAFVLASPHMVARPHALALPVMVAWVAGLLSAVEHRRRPPFLLLPLITLWANLHGGFTFGLVLIGPVALEALLQAERHERVSVFAHWALFGVAALGAACLTPYGPESLLVTLRILGLGPVLALIGEWRPQDFSTVTGFELCLLGGIGFALYRGVTLPPVRLLVILGLLYMGLSAARNGELLGLLGPLFLAAPLAARFGAAEPRHGRQTVAPAIAALLAAFVATVAVARAAAFEPRAEIRPEQALAAVRASGRDHLLNSYDFGGYLIAQGVPVFIDGRTELYGKDFVLRTDAAETLRDPGALFDLLSQYAIDVTMLAPGTPAAGLLDHMPGWKRIYADGVAVVHVRVAPGAAVDPHAAVIDPHAAVAD